MPMSAGRKYQPVRGGDTANRRILLKGSLLPPNVKTVVFFATNIRDAPRTFTSPYIVEFEELTPSIDNCHAWALNQTNTARLCEMLASEQKCRPERADLEQATNRKWLLAVTTETNPNTEEKVASLALFRLGPVHRAVRSAPQEMQDMGICDDDIPEEFRGQEDPGPTKVYT